MCVLQQPSAIALPPGPEQINRFVHPRVRLISYHTEVVKGTQDVIIPAGRIGELQPRSVDDFASALASE